MIDLTIFQNFLIALGIGALIGLEREYARYKKRGHDYAGIRTFPLIALFGALTAYLSDKYSVWVLIVGLVLIGGLIVFAYYLTTRKSKVHFGATSEMAGLLTFFIGILCYNGEILFALSLGIILTIILYARSALHRLAEKITKEEMRDTLLFVVFAFLILPFLPNENYVWVGLFNPFIIWLMVVLISGISFVGYLLMKWIGEKGIVLSGLLGGLISSTAVTSSFALRSKKEKLIYKALSLGVIIANGIMFIRILLIVSVINKNLFIKVWPVMLILTVITAVFSYFIWRKAKKIKGKIKLGSPFTLGPALKFGAFFAAILALVKISDYYFSSKGVYLVSFISGFADVDAITVSLSQLAKEGLDLATAAKGIILAALSNIAVKGGIAWWFGGKEFSKIVLGLFAILMVVGAGLMLSL